MRASLSRSVPGATTNLRVLRILFADVIVGVFYYFTWSVILFGYGAFGHGGILSAVQFGAVVGLFIGVIGAIRRFGRVASAMLGFCVAVLLHIVVFAMPLIISPYLYWDKVVLSRLFVVCILLDILAAVPAGLTSSYMRDSLRSSDLEYEVDAR